MSRVAAAETLDELDVLDPRAVRSRADLRRIHRVMGTRGILRRGLADVFEGRRSVPRLLELGAGDGTLMLGVARSLARAGCVGHVSLLDRQACVNPRTIDEYTRLGWTVAPIVADVRDWVEEIAARENGGVTRWDAIVANLFLHHFDDARLRSILEAVASVTGRFFACEPRRGWFPLAASHLVGALGANQVTRNDAVLSVRAGFADNELSRLWPAPHDGWQLHEYRAGLFSHCLRATRRASD